MLGRWTANEVRSRLIEAFRLAPLTPVYTPDRGEMVTALGGAHTLEWDLVAATYHCLGRDATEAARQSRCMLLTWARVMALNGGHANGASLAEICREQGWNVRTFQRRVDAACEQMATILDIASSIGRRVLDLTMSAPERSDRPRGVRAEQIS